MNNLFVYLEIEDGSVHDVSLELLTKGRSLANQLGVALEAIAITDRAEGIADTVMPYGVDKLHLFVDPRLEHYQTLPHASIVIKLFQQEKPQICLLGATTIGRDLGPRVSSSLGSGLTADCTSLEIGDYTDKDKEFKNLLYQIRPAFGGNIVATIVNPEHRPQMATVRPGVMKKEIYKADHKGEVTNHAVADFVRDEDFVIEIIDRHVAKSKINLGGEVGATRAAVDAGFTEHERQIGQTGVTVRPKLYIACGISGQIQHVAGMQESSMIISINTDPDAPINTIADYVITGRIEEVIPKLIKYYKQNSK